MEVGVDEGRRHQASRGVDLPRRPGGNCGGDLDDPPVLDPDIEAFPTVGQIGVADDQVEP